MQAPREKHKHLIMNSNAYAMLALHNIVLMILTHDKLISKMECITQNSCIMIKANPGAHVLMSKPAHFPLYLPDHFHQPLIYSVAYLPGQRLTVIF